MALEPAETFVRILVVDDEEASRDVLETVLRRKGYRVTTAPNGAEALSRLDAHPADLVLTDIRMPGMSGVALIRAIKERAPETVVVLITGYGSLDTAIQAIRAGAYDYLTKPFQLDELYVLVHNAVERIQLIRENRRLLREMERCYRDAKTGGQEGTAPEDGAASLSSVTDECCFPERLQALERHLLGIYTRQPAGVPEKAVGRSSVTDECGFPSSVTDECGFPVSGFRDEEGEEHGG